MVLRFQSPIVYIKHRLQLWHFQQRSVVLAKQTSEGEDAIRHRITIFVWFCIAFIHVICIYL